MSCRIFGKTSGNSPVSLKYLHSPIIGKKHIARLEAPEILALVKSIEGKGNHETARRVLQIIGQVFRCAIAMGKIKHNIAADLHGALRPRKVTHRAAVLEKEKVAQLLMAIDEYAGYFPLVWALKLAPMLFVRPTELRCDTWQEFDLDAAEWRIPGERMKMRRTHIVPLSRQALAILRELKKFSGEGQYLFPSMRTERRPISDATMLNAVLYMASDTNVLQPPPS